MRTAWEKDHILSLKDLEFARRFFIVRNVRFWHLFSILAVPLRNSALFERILKILNALDSIVLRVSPFSLLAWIFTFELVKRNDN